MVCVGTVEVVGNVVVVVVEVVVDVGSTVVVVGIIVVVVVELGHSSTIKLITPTTAQGSSSSSRIAKIKMSCSPPGTSNIHTMGDVWGVVPVTPQLFHCSPSTSTLVTTRASKL